MLVLIILLIIILSIWIALFNLELKFRFENCEVIYNEKIKNKLDIRCLKLYVDLIIFKRIKILTIKVNQEYCEIYKMKFNINGIKLSKENSIEITKLLLDEFINELKESVKAEKDAVEKELEALKAQVDPSLMEKYLKKRADKIYPIVYALRDSVCGACNMELPMSELGKLKNGAVIECEHCGKSLPCEVKSKASAIVTRKYDLSYVFNRMEESNLDIQRKRYLVDAARRASVAAF